MTTPSAWTLDISSSAVKLLGLARRKKADFEVIHASRTAYDSRGMMADAIKRAVASASLESSFVATSVWASTMIIRKISLPRLRPQEVPGALQLEADKYVPFGLDECILDHFPFPADPQGQKTDVMLVASKKDLILERCKLLEDAGLKLWFMDIDPVALTNWLLIRRPESARGTRALIHIGDAPGRTQGEDSFIIILKDGVPWVIRDLGERFSAPEVSDEACSQTAALAANALVFFENMAHDKPSEILLSADDAIAPKLAESVEKAARLKPVRWQAAENILFRDDEVERAFSGPAASFAPALGVCARALLS
jgi:hypothetical protein